MNNRKIIKSLTDKIRTSKGLVTITNAEIRNIMLRCGLRRDSRTISEFTHRLAKAILLELEPDKYKYTLLHNGIRIETAA